MRIYKLRPEGFERVRLGVMKRVGWIMLLIPALVISCMAYFDYQQSGKFGWSEIGIYGFIVAVLTAMMLWGLFKGFDRAQRSWSAYEIILDNDRIIRKERELPDMEIHRTEITRVIRAPGDRLRIETADPQRFIAIPEGIENFDQLANFLPLWASVETQTETSRQWLSGVVAGGTVIAFLIMNYSSNTFAVVGGALLLVGLQLWVVVAIRRSPLCPAKTKRNYTLMCTFVTLIAVFRLMTFFSMR